MFIHVIVDDKIFPEVNIQEVLIVIPTEKRVNERPQDKAVRVLFENGAYDSDFDVFNLCGKVGVILKTYIEGEGLIKSLHLEREKKGKNGFISTFNGKKIIFYDNELNQKETQFIVAHELGHYLLGHSEKNWNKAKYEREANIFAHECMKLMYPESPHTRKQQHMKIVKIVASVAIILAMGFSAFYIANGYKTVYITRTGDKYHKETCGHLSDTKIEMTLREAQKAGYEPCSMCKP